MPKCWSTGNRRLSFRTVAGRPEIDASSPSSPYQISLGTGVAAIPAAEWDALVDANDPFLEHAFLLALERSGSVGRGTGWLPRFVLVRELGETGAKRLVAAAPLYLKSHSYGEFVFDWAWAAAADRAGLEYYPKLVTAVPFTPVTGQRLLTHPEADRQVLLPLLIRGLRETAERTGASSIHVLFCRDDEFTALQEAGFHARLGLQFHWTNRQPQPYASFDDFLSAFRSRNRKQVRKERAVAAGHGLELVTRPGTELGDADWVALEAFYEANIDKHGGARYLTPAFFKELRQHLPHRVVASLAYRPGEGRGGNARPVAGTLNFERGRHLYGRYWGCLEDREMLHFELCYYQLIERAVTRGYTRFEAGAQGEHKLKRGLEPTLTLSAHWLADRGLSSAVGRFLQTERAAAQQELLEYQQLSPYARVTGTDPV
jgi:predicted N-acyltransferase